MYVCVCDPPPPQASLIGFPIYPKYILAAIFVFGVCIALANFPVHWLWTAAMRWCVEFVLSMWSCTLTWIMLCGVELCVVSFCPYLSKPNCSSNLHHWNCFLSSVICVMCARGWWLHGVDGCTGKWHTTGWSVTKWFVCLRLFKATTIGWCKWMSLVRGSSMWLSVVLMQFFAWWSLHFCWHHTLYTCTYSRVNRFMVHIYDIMINWRPCRIQLNRTQSQLSQSEPPGRNWGERESAGHSVTWQNAEFCRPYAR